MPELFTAPGVTSALLLANFRQFQNNPTASLADMYAYQNAQQQRSRISVPITAGRGTWTFPRPFPDGVTPVVQIGVETPDATSYLYDAKVIAGSVTSTKADFVVNRFNASQTLGGTLTAIVNTVIAIFAPLAGPTTVTIHASAATATG